MTNAQVARRLPAAPSHGSPPARLASNERRRERRPRSPAPIADYGLLADCNSAALVARGRLDRLALPAALRQSRRVRADPRPRRRPLVDQSQAGEFTSERRYLDGTLGSRTTFTTDDGSVKLVDAMASPRGSADTSSGRRAARSCARRGRLRQVELELELAARPEYGLVTAIPQAGARRADVRGPTGSAFSAGSPGRGRGRDDAAAFTVSAGDRSASRSMGRRRSASRARAGGRRSPAPKDTDNAAGARGRPSTTLRGPHRDLVRLSARVLKGLTYRPTGAIVAARPRSLPETWAASATGTTASPGSATRA